jgi:hypothetical protein
VSYPAGSLTGFFGFFDYVHVLPANANATSEMRR